MSNNRRVMGIKVNSKDNLDAEIRPIVDFIKKLPRAVRGRAVVNLNPGTACFGQDLSSYHTPRRFWIGADLGGNWEIEAYFGENGSKKQAEEFLQLLKEARITSIMAFGPLHDHWHEEKISPVALLATMGIGIANEIPETAHQPLTDSHAPYGSDT